MVKLLKILKEIKLIPNQNVSPEIVFELDREILKKIGDQQQDDEYYKIFSNLGLNGNNFYQVEQYKSLSKDNLILIYNGLLKFKEKYNL